DILFALASGVKYGAATVAGLELMKQANGGSEEHGEEMDEDQDEDEDAEEAPNSSPKESGSMSNAEKAKADLLTLSRAVRDYGLQNGGAVPDSLGRLLVPDKNGATYIQGGKLPQDPWGQDYFFKSDSKSGTFEIGTYGKDKV